MTLKGLRTEEVEKNVGSADRGASHAQPRRPMKLPAS